MIDTTIIITVSLLLPLTVIILTFEILGWKGSESLSHSNQCTYEFSLSNKPWSLAKHNFSITYKYALQLKKYVKDILQKYVMILSDTCSYMFILYWFITNSQNDQLPVGLIAQLVEHGTGNARLVGSIPVQAWIF